MIEITVIIDDVGNMTSILAFRNGGQSLLSHMTSWLLSNSWNYSCIKAKFLFSDETQFQLTIFDLYVYTSVK